MSDNDTLAQLPDQLPGHWDTAHGREMAERYLKEGRHQLGKGDVSDMALANAQFLEDISVGTITFQSAIAMQTAAKERIRWLSAQLAAANIALARQQGAEDALRDLRRGYLILLENARDRIIFLGGECDSLKRMIEGDTYLRAADAALGARR